jgi:hypothetical protein
MDKRNMARKGKIPLASFGRDEQGKSLRRWCINSKPWAQDRLIVTIILRIIRPFAIMAFTIETLVYLQIINYGLSFTNFGQFSSVRMDELMVVLLRFLHNWLFPLWDSRLSRPWKWSLNSGHSVVTFQKMVISNFSITSISYTKAQNEHKSNSMSR